MANEVVIHVTADTKKAGKGLDGIRDKMKKVGMGATAAGGLITSFAAKSLQQFSSIGDEIHKMGLRTGFSAKSLSQLRVAADLSGTSLGAMETGIKKMQRTVADASDGLGMAVSQFEKLGITMEEIKGMTPEEQFIKLLKATANLEDQNERTQVAMNLFGKAGVDMLPMLADGEQAFEDMLGKAAELGMEFDDLAAKKAADLTDAMGNMKASMTGVMLMVAENLAPIITDLATFIEKTVSKVTAWTEANPKLTGVIVKVVAALGLLMLVVGPLMLAFGAITTIAPFVAGAFAIMTGPIGIIVLAIAALGLAWATNFGGIRDKTKEVFDFLSRIYQSKLGWLLPGGALIKGLLFIKDNWIQIWEAIAASFRMIINELIGMLNGFIRGLNKIKVPDWVPEWMGGGKGINIPEIPLLGRGTSARITPAQGMGSPTDVSAKAISGGRFGGRTDFSAFEKLATAIKVDAEKATKATEESTKTPVSHMVSDLANAILDKQSELLAWNSILYNQMRHLPGDPVTFTPVGGLPQDYDPMKSLFEMGETRSEIRIIIELDGQVVAEALGARAYTEEQVRSR